MAYFVDLEPCDYFGHHPALLAIGWLDRAHPFTIGKVDERFFERLVTLLGNPWQPAVAAGVHPCELCQFSGGPGVVHCQQVSCQVGGSNLFVPWKDKLLVAPSLVAHYIDAHRYQPPNLFQEAVMQCHEMRSMAYLKQIEGKIPLSRSSSETPR